MTERSTNFRYSVMIPRAVELLRQGKASGVMPFDLKDPENAMAALLVARLALDYAMGDFADVMPEVDDMLADMRRETYAALERRNAKGVSHD